MMNQLGGRGKVIQIRSKGSHCLLLSSYPTHCSSTAVALNTIMFVVPLSSMASILKHRDSSSVFLPWAAASTVCSLCWVRALLCTHTRTHTGRQAGRQAGRQPGLIHPINPPIQTLYGLIGVKDILVAFPNVVGLVLGGLQLTLRAIFPAK